MEELEICETIEEKWSKNKVMVLNFVLRSIQYESLEVGTQDKRLKTKASR